VKRLLVEKIPAVGELADVAGDELHHLLKVRRVKGEIEVELLDGQGSAAKATLTPLDRRRAEVRVTQHLDDQRESPLNLTMALAIPESKSTLESIIPGLVQLGTRRILLIHSEYGGRLKGDSEKSLNRLREIARQSLKQCGRTQLPEITLAKSFSAGVETDTAETKIMLHPGESKPDQTGQQPKSISIWVGPEGGFSETEVNLWREQTGGHLQNLGPRILKMETAVIGAAFHIQRCYGDLH
jgi:16S rRNA (uracil1498-N3)-methyltransferase